MFEKIGAERRCLDLHPVRVPRDRLRHLHLHLEEPMGGVRGARPRRVSQVRLAHHRIHPHLAVGVEVGRPLDIRHIVC